MAAFALMVMGYIALWPLWALAQLPPLPDGLRHEPAPTVGARVSTERGLGVITAAIRYADTVRWQVRLEDGRYVVLYRAQLEVIQ